MYQFGSFGSASISAYSLTAEFGFIPKSIDWHPHIWFGVDYASGDTDPNDDTLGTFDPLFPQVALWFGEHGLIDRKNLLSLSGNFDFSPFKHVTSRFTYWNFSRASAEDAVYNTTNGILRPAGEGNSKDLGNSIQLTNVYQPAYQWEFTLTYNLWVPGRFFGQTQTEKASSQHFFMVTAQYTF